MSDLQEGDLVYISPDSHYHGMGNYMNPTCDVVGEVISIAEDNIDNLPIRVLWLHGEGFIEEAENSYREKDLIKI